MGATITGKYPKLYFGDEEIGGVSSWSFDHSQGGYIETSRCWVNGVPDAPEKTFEFTGTYNPEIDRLQELFNDGSLKVQTLSFYHGSKLASYWQNPLFNWLMPPNDGYGKYNFMGKITVCDFANGPDTISVSFLIDGKILDGCEIDKGYGYEKI